MRKLIKSVLEKKEPFDVWKTLIITLWLHQYAKPLRMSHLYIGGPKILYLQRS